MIRNLLSHPLTAGLDIDSPETTQLRRQIIRTKPFLKQIYLEWYQFLLSGSSERNGAILEIGSGAGLVKELAPRTITSDIFRVDDLEVILDAQHLPFRNGSLGTILLANVLHHIPQPGLLFAEATRCLAAGGQLRMIEPWLTPWSRWVYTHLHHEPVDELTKEWKIAGTGPLSSANTALPWIIFHRDLQIFVQRFPTLKVKTVLPYMPFRYLVSGGISLRSLMPSFTFSIWRLLEAILSPLRSLIGMFVKIVLEKSSS